MISNTKNKHNKNRVITHDCIEYNTIPGGERERFTLFHAKIGILA